MTKQITVSFLLTILLFPSAFSQDKNNNLKINIFSPIAKTLNLQYEHKLTADQSFQFGAFYTGYSSVGTSLSGIGLTSEYRFYLTNEVFNGVYIAPYLRYQNYTLTDDQNDKGTLTTFGGGLIFGRQWLFKDKITFDIFIGPSYNSGFTKVTAGTNNFQYNGSINGFGVRGGVCFGFAF
jgi:hypothetical protein